MSSDQEGPKLFTNKPKKTQLKAKDYYAPSSAAAASYSNSMGSPPPPPQPPKESFARRYKFLWPLLLGVNFAVGAYLFTRTKKKDASTTEDVLSDVPSATTSATSVPTAPLTTSVSTAPVAEKILPTLSTTEPVKSQEPVLESQQRELFKWILEEKRKLKPKDPEEKKRIDEEKAILKEFMRAKSIPTF